MSFNAELLLKHKLRYECVLNTFSKHKLHKKITAVIIEHFIQLDVGNG